MDENREPPLHMRSGGAAIATGELSVVSGTDARRSPRRIVNLAAALRDEGTSSWPVRIFDISEEGCRIETDAAIETGANVLIKLPGFEAKRSSVRWVKESQAGCEFEIPLYAAEIELMTKQVYRPKPNQVFRRR